MVLLLYNEGQNTKSQKKRRSQEIYVYKYMCIYYTRYNSVITTDSEELFYILNRNRTN